jgi:uncharacterized protein (DUF885 family)
MMLLASSGLAQSKLEQNFAKLSNQIIENLQSFYPVIATGRGIHDYDYRFTDYSSGSIRGEISRLKKFEVRLHKYIKSNLSEASSFNLRLLKSNVDMAMLDLNKIRRYRYDPYMYVDDAINGIYLVMISEYAPLSIRVHNVIARFKAVPDLLRQAQQNIKAPPPVYIRLADEMLTTGIDFYRSVQTELAAGFPELATEINTAADAAVAAMQSFQTFLAEVEPGAENAYSIGKENFDYRLKHEYFLDYDSDSLVKIGEYLLEKYLQEHKEFLAGLQNDGSSVDSVFVIDCLTREDILRYYNWETKQARLFIEENDLLTIPEDIGECRVIETPPFLTNVVTSIAYQPPGVYSPSQTGYFYVRPIPDSMDQKLRESKYRYIQRRGFKGSVVHEAYPGHHLQFQMAARIEDPVRKWQENASLYEGWALYCEQMMYDQGFYGDDRRSYLKVLRGIIFRAARIVVDVKLHTGQMTRDEAVAWMAAKLNTDTTWIGIEVDRYTLTPTIPMSYLIGKEGIMKLRDAVRIQQGENFDLKEFHDRLLSFGSFPPSLIWEIWDLKKQ